MTEDIIDKAKKYGIACHNSTACSYDIHPYEYHLTMVFNTAKRFLPLIQSISALQEDDVLAACWVHDVIEDCRQTYNDVKKETNEYVAEIAYALTNEKGKSRKERANDKYYVGIAATPGATFVKICDRISNVEYSKNIHDKQGTMFEKYRKENTEFVEKLWNQEYKPMFDYLNSLFTQ